MFKVQIKINNAKYKKKDEKYVLIFKNALALIKFLIFSNIVLIENPWKWPGLQLVGNVLFTDS